MLAVSANAQGDEARTLNRTALDATVAAGAGRVFSTSHVGQRPVSEFGPMTVHHATEAAGRELSVPFTALRNGFYAEFAPNLIGDAVESGELRAPQDGPMSWTTHPDLADAIAAILAGDDTPGHAVDLTASEAVDLADIATIVAEITGRDIRRVVVDTDTFRDQLAARGLPDGMISSSMGIYAAAHDGDVAQVDPTLERLIGRPPTSIREVFEATLSSAM